MTPDLSLETALAMLALDRSLGGIMLLGGDGWEMGAAASGLAAALGPHARVLRLPVDITPDHLLGGLDLDATLRHGTRVVRPGLLADHDGGVLWLPDPDLLPPEIAFPLATALRRGTVHLERDGLSAHHRTRLLLLTATAASAPLRYPALLDLAALWLPGTTYTDVQKRTTHYALRTTHYAEISDDQIASLAAVALRLDVPGLRADYLAARAARAIATLAGRPAVEDAHLELAVAFVLGPRAKRQESGDGGRKSEDSRRESGENTQYALRTTPEELTQDSKLITQNSAQQLIAARAAWLPKDLLPELTGVRRFARRGEVGAGRALGERRLLPARHGRPGQPRADTHRPPGAMLDLSATLEAAAWRLVGLRGNPPCSTRALRLRPEELRWRAPVAPAGVLFLLAVDASGSMARNRLGPAKGAAILLLERAYLRRDRVALIGISGPDAALLLPPTRSTARARRLLEGLPAGGGTPLASALALGLELATRAGSSGYGHTLLVLLTDGRANVPLAAPPSPEGIAAEVSALSGRWAALCASGAAATLVIDTRLRYLSAGEAPALAQALAARYLYLPHATPIAIGRAAEETARLLRIA